MTELTTDNSKGSVEKQSTGAELIIDESVDLHVGWWENAFRSQTQDNRGYANYRLARLSPRRQNAYWELSPAVQAGRIAVAEGIKIKENEKLRFERRRIDPQPPATFEDWSETLKTWSPAATFMAAAIEYAGTHSNEDTDPWGEAFRALIPLPDDPDNPQVSDIDVG